MFALCQGVHGNPNGRPATYSPQPVSHAGPFSQLAALAWETVCRVAGTDRRQSPTGSLTSGFRGITAGSDLLSHTVSHAVPSAVASLTSVFGMGTGVTLLL